MIKTYDKITIGHAIDIAIESGARDLDLGDAVIKALPLAEFLEALANYSWNEFERDCGPLDLLDDGPNYGILCTSHYLDNGAEIDMQLTYNTDTGAYNFYYGAAVFGDLNAPDFTLKRDIEAATNDLLNRDFYDMLTDKLYLLIDNGMEV